MTGEILSVFSKTFILFLIHEHFNFLQLGQDSRLMADFILTDFYSAFHHYLNIYQGQVGKCGWLFDGR